MSLKNTGEILKSTREKLGISIESVSKKLKIQEKYIKAFEENDNSVFDSMVIPRGFLLKYCNLLNLDGSRILAYWRRDFVLTQKNLVRKNTYLKFVITPKKILFSIFGVFVLSIFIFFSFEYIKFKSPPKLEVTSIQQDQVIFDESVIVEGFADKNASVFINEKEIKIDSDGRFAQKIFLQNGENTINISSISPLGAKNSKTLSVKAQYTSQNNIPNLTGRQVLRVKCISQNSSFYEVKDKNSILFSGFALNGVEKTFYGENLYIYTDSVESLEIYFMDNLVLETKDKYGKFSKTF